MLRRRNLAFFDLAPLWAVLLLLSVSLTACKRERAPEARLATPLPAWEGTITDLAMDRAVGWVFANVRSLRETPEFSRLMNEMVPRTGDALAGAVVDASQLFIAWGTYSDDSRLSVVRTRLPAETVIASIRAENTVSGLQESTGPEGLPLWGDGEWAIAAPAENLVIAGPREHVVQTSLKLLDNELSETDQLSNSEGVTFSLEVTPEMRAALVARLENATIERAVAPIERMNGKLTIDGPLELDATVYLKPSGSPTLLATILRLGWARLAPPLLAEWFQPAYAERLADGFDARAADDKAQAVEVRYRLPEADTRLWLSALASSDFIAPASGAAERSPNTSPVRSTENQGAPADDPETPEEIAPNNDTVATPDDRGAPGPDHEENVENDERLGGDEAAARDTMPARSEGATQDKSSRTPPPRSEDSPRPPRAEREKSSPPSAPDRPRSREPSPAAEPELETPTTLPP